MTASFLNFLGCWILTMLFAVGKIWGGLDLTWFEVASPVVAVNGWYGLIAAWGEREDNRDFGRDR